MIDKIFEELSPYLRGIKKAEDYSVVEVNLKNTWLIPENHKIQNQNKPTKIKDEVYYMFFSSELGFDGMLDWLKKEVIDMNIELEQKEALLKSKVEQLKEIFENNSLEDLENMDFGTNKENPLKLGKGTNKEKKVEVETKDETVEV